MVVAVVVVGARKVRIARAWLLDVPERKMRALRPMMLRRRSALEASEGQVLPFAAVRCCPLQSRSLAVELPEAWEYDLFSSLTTPRPRVECPRDVPCRCRGRMEENCEHHSRVTTPTIRSPPAPTPALAPPPPHLTRPHNHTLLRNRDDKFG